MIERFTYYHRSSLWPSCWGPAFRAAAQHRGHLMARPTRKPPAWRHYHADIDQSDDAIMAREGRKRERFLAVAPEAEEI